MSNRITKLVSSGSDRKYLVPFLTAGFPDSKTFLDIVKLSIDCGVDMIEIGAPFSDPMADGPEVQFSSFKSLENGTKIKDIFGYVKSIREYSQIPLIIMGYYNPILAYGQSEFMKDINKVGIDGLIIPDLPIDEAEEFKFLADKNDVSTIFLASPTSTDKRLKLVNKFSTGFVYAVTVTGVTGTGKVFGKETDNYFKRLKKVLNQKFVAGFGISNASDARKMIKYADGVVIGSAIIKIIRNSKSKKEMLKNIERLLKSIRNAI